MQANHFRNQMWFWGAAHLCKHVAIQECFHRSFCGHSPGLAVHQVDDAAEFIIDETFQVAGVGVVVAGTVKRGTLLQGASLLLGPHAGDASFKPTAIKSIAYKRLPVNKVRHLTR